MLNATKKKDVVICKDSHFKKLVWQDDVFAKTNKLNWNDAKKQCENLTLNDFNDWRLPNIKELRSIVDFTKAKPAVDGAFKNVASRFYWSSSSYVGDESKAWFVLLLYGGDRWNKKSLLGSVRCVR